LTAFGIQQFIYGDFVAGRAPAWPAEVPGGFVWAYLTGAIFVVCGLAIVAGIKARWAAITVGSLLFVWALLRHVPGLIEPSGMALTQTGKALALFGGAFALAGSMPSEKNGKFGSTDGFIWLGRICLGAFFILAGIQHFYYAQFVATLVPSWIPGAAFWTYFTGLALIAGGIGVLTPITSRLAALMSGLMIFSWFLLLHIPRALAAATGAQSKNEWIAVFEALSMSGIALVLTAGSRNEN
ncbi:MAG TPA: DoxX family membrane protein, partial [Pyrinomonadaceae bacterium]|nr:DoxX family membrane protein [Pyrinomonadaceae bacterium]